MKLTKLSEKTIKYLLKINDNKNRKFPIIDNIIKSFYKEIIIAEKHIKMLLPSVKKTITNINNFNSISTLIHFSPKLIQENITHNNKTLITYSVTLLKKDIIVNCIVEEKDLNSIYKYENMLTMILIWLKFVFSYTKNNTLKELTINIALTDFKKKLPETNINILDDINCNTGSTYACKSSTEIFIYRKEEWFKVFIHETFHSLCLDFSMMQTNKFNEKIKTLFPINSKFNLYESYSECWAEIFNIIFCSFFIIEDKNNYKDLKMYFDFFLYNEKIHSLLQCVKILNFYNLTYENLYKKNEISEISRKQYKEKTNVFAYYFIKAILIFNAEKFMKWCYKTNINILTFSKTETQLNKFYSFIKHHYNDKDFVENMNKIHKRYMETNDDFILTNLRMTVSELDV